MMLQYIHIYNHHFSRGGGHITPLMGLLIFIVSTYIVYFIGICVGRSLGEYTRKQFILYLLIPYSAIFIWFINLFKEDKKW